ncbi:MAG: phosphatase 2C-like domain-containing protein [Lentinula lateritia]|uniref:Protein serine/threonine phosphatase 2C n=1 Tax=Lentinula lateritia TaxID=40482 RepID=A0ABQ8VRC8_9AGAR|nr:MAG: phosphatase 2C-like domain-containing protein [Lentinula lateritia]KAJ4497155.1 protein serine/threonine phosphatase 2C [Lentinula lateritia]
MSRSQMRSNGQKDPAQNAYSEPITRTSGSDSFGVLNRIPTQYNSYQIGVHEAQGMRPTMEDTHAFIVDFDSVRGQGYFGVFDGHGNKCVSEWCGQEFHKIFLNCIHKNPTLNGLDVLKKSFLEADEVLGKMSEGSDELADSGSTAVVAFLRIEDSDGSQNFPHTDLPEHGKVKVPPQDARRVFYCGNVGDARGVMCRNGTATRLTHDHKPSDSDEQARIRGAGGIVLRGRVFGTLAVSRSLGDHMRYESLKLKDLVIGTPYLSRTELKQNDEFCIIACDGLWDIISDQDAVDLARTVDDAEKASRMLVEYALKNDNMISRDNVTVMVIRFTNTTLVDHSKD